MFIPDSATAQQYATAVIFCSAVAELPLWARASWLAGRECPIAGGCSLPVKAVASVVPPSETALQKQLDCGYFSNIGPPTEKSEEPPKQPAKSSKKPQLPILGNTQTSSGITAREKADTINRGQFAAPPITHCTQTTKKGPTCGFPQIGRITGNGLLSHNLEMHYHWRYGVSLPCSGWERVVPPCKDHQTPKISTFKFEIFVCLTTQ